jgi:hypothetical protein
LLTII